MDYTRLGRSGLKVSRIAYGSWRTTSSVDGEKNSILCHQKAFENGINFFDTADVYNQGQAETVVGKFINQNKRSDLVIATKSCGTMGNQPNDKGLSRKHIIEACHQSLKRLNTDYIDLYQAHSEDKDTPIEETVSAYQLLQQQGKILYWGVSNWGAESMTEAKEVCTKFNWDFMISNQPKYNMFHRKVEANGTQLFCQANGVGMILYSPLDQGLLTDKYRNNKIPEGSRATERDAMAEELKKDYYQKPLLELYKLADELGVPLSSIALQWLLNQKAVTSTIIGAKTPDQISENLKCMNFKLTTEIKTRIDDILERRNALIFKDDMEGINRKYGI